MNRTEQFDPQLIWFELPGLEVEVTVPLPRSRWDLVTVSGNVCSVKAALMVSLPLTVTVHVEPDMVSQPVQPVKSDPVAGVAVSVRTVPIS